MSWLLALLGPLTSIISGFFSMKKEQSAVDIAEIAAEASVANSGIKTQPAIIAAENGANNSFLSRNWRPAACILFSILIVARFVGYLGPHLPMELEEVYVTGMFALMGAYFLARSFDKRSK